MRSLSLSLLLLSSLFVLASVIDAHVPLCSYMCDDPVCPAICEPICEAPRCSIFSNMTLALDVEPPECETICRSGANDACNLGEGCPVCETRCKRPFCGTGVAWCQIECEAPICMCQCRKPVCPVPKCELQCQLHPCDNGASTLEQATLAVQPQQPTTSTATITSSSSSIVAAITTHTEKKRKHKKHHRNSSSATRNILSVFFSALLTIIIIAATQ